MALGRTIVSTTIGAEGIEYTNGENIFIANSPDTFFDKLSVLLENPDLIERMGEKASSLARQKYDVVKVTKELINLYNQHLA